MNKINRPVEHDSWACYSDVVTAILGPAGPVPDVQPLCMVRADGPLCLCLSLRPATRECAPTFTIRILWLARRLSTVAWGHISSAPTHKRTWMAGSGPWTRPRWCKAMAWRGQSPPAAANLFSGLVSRNKISISETWAVYSIKYNRITLTLFIYLF